MGKLYLFAKKRPLSSHFIFSDFSGFSIFFLFFLFFSSLACDKLGTKSPSNEPIKVAIPVYMKDGTYQFQTTYLRTLIDLSEVRGQAAYFIINSQTGGRSDFGRAPQIKLIKNNEGVYFATDDLGLQLLTVYSHFEKMKLWDQTIGISRINPEPCRIHISTIFPTHIVSGKNADNAFFNTLNFFAFLPYSQTSLPLLINGGVVAHEYFHSLFYYIIIKPLGKKALGFIDHDFNKSIKLETATKGPRERPIKDPNKDPKVEFKYHRFMYHKILLRGLNEGLADFWSWLVMGDENFVARSVDGQELRKLDQTPKQIPTITKLQAQVKALIEVNDKIGECLFYPLGTYHALILKSITQDFKELYSKEEIAFLLIQALEKFKKKLEEIKAEEYLSPDEFFVFLKAELTKIKPEAIEKLNETLFKLDPNADSLLYNCKGNPDSSSSRLIGSSPSPYRARGALSEENFLFHNNQTEESEESVK